LRQILIESWRQRCVSGDDRAAILGFQLLVFVDLMKNKSTGNWGRPSYFVRRWATQVSGVPPWGRSDWRTPPMRL
jgi:hypothetical protein